jgi:hypothetical protein
VRRRLVSSAQNERLMLLVPSRPFHLPCLASRSGHQSRRTRARRRLANDERNPSVRAGPCPCAPGRWAVGPRRCARRASRRSPSPRRCATGRGAPPGGWSATAAGSCCACKAPDPGRRSWWWRSGGCDPCPHAADHPLRRPSWSARSRPARRGSERRPLPRVDRSTSRAPYNLVLSHDCSVTRVFIASTVAWAQADPGDCDAGAKGGGPRSFGRRALSVADSPNSLRRPP